MKRSEKEKARPGQSKSVNHRRANLSSSSGDSDEDNNEPEVKPRSGFRPVESVKGVKRRREERHDMAQVSKRRRMNEDPSSSSRDSNSSDDSEMAGDGADEQESDSSSIEQDNGTANRVSKINEDNNAESDEELSESGDDEQKSGEMQEPVENEIDEKIQEISFGERRKIESMNVGAAEKLTPEAKLELIRREARRLQLLKKSNEKSKERPAEMSSKIPVSRKRQVIHVQKQRVRDPRFDSLSGHFNEEGGIFGIIDCYAAQLCLREAMQFNHPGAYSFASLHEVYPGGGKNFVKFYRKSAEDGDALALHVMGALHLNGVGVEKDVSLSINYFERSAKLNYIRGIHSLATVFCLKQYNINEHKRGLELARSIQHKLFPPVYTLIGYIYYIGLGVEKDHEESLKWSLKGAEWSHPTALNNLGMIYCIGLAVPVDVRKGIDYSKMSLDSFSGASALYLGSLYYSGSSIAFSADLAYMYFIIAGEYGIGEGYYYAGQMHDDGVAPEANKDQAKKFWKLAAKMGSEAAKLELKSRHWADYVDLREEQDS